MTLTPRQWTMAFAAALTTHALAAGTLPQSLSSRTSDPPLPKPILVSLATLPAPVSPAPAVAPPASAPTPPPRPPVASQPEPEMVLPPEVVEPPEPAAVPAPVQQAPFPRPSVAAIDPAPVATPQAPSRETTTPVNDHNTNLNTTEEAPSNTTTAAAPTSVLETVDLARLKSQHVKIFGNWLNKHKRYPTRAKYRGDEGTVLVRFTVNRHGEVLDYDLEGKSGNTLLDKEALATIRRAKRAEAKPVFSDELAEVRDIITIVVQIKFQIE